MVSTKVLMSEGTQSVAKYLMSDKLDYERKSSLWS